MRAVVAGRNSVKPGLSFRLSGAALFASGAPLAVLCYAIPGHGYQRGKGNDDDAD